MFNKITGNTNFLEKALDGSWTRHKAINQNISNADTPRYKKISVKFEDQLKNAITNDNNKLHITNEKHIPYVGHREKCAPEIIKQDNYSYRFDGNNVNMDVEQAELAKNTIMYDALVRAVTDEYEKIKNVISEGSK